MGCALSSAENQRDRKEESYLTSSSANRSNQKTAKNNEPDKMGQHLSQSNKQLASFPSTLEEKNLPALFSSDGRVVCHPQSTFKKYFSLSHTEAGSGSFGVVLVATENYSSTSSQKDKVAVKIMEIRTNGLIIPHQEGNVPLVLDDIIERAKARSPEEAPRLEMLRREVTVQSKVKNANILPLKCIFYHVEYDRLSVAMVLPLANAGTLQQLLQRRKQQGSPLAPAESKTILRGILGGVAHLHQHGVAHRDLKPENILLHRKPTATAEVSERGRERKKGTMKSSPFAITPTATHNLQFCNILILYLTPGL
uniref:Protein kinase domain-containing protein n=2 Tax=Palpitomonas bilix TaxID=652834 RepID=A0A7S3D9T0_9EUKA|mmetsp:Transcript_26320/g.67013  ORF Transcript_26320/g.67013 Transcript_26320/m.67013 type:complete len:310 (+) Transcript_26320:379-1308(+)